MSHYECKFCGEYSGLCQCNMPNDEWLEYTHNRNLWVDKLLNEQIVEARKAYLAEYDRLFGPVPELTYPHRP